MSTSLDIPSTSGIVLVDNTQNNDAIITSVQVQSHDQEHHHHHHHHRQNNYHEESLSGATAAVGNIEYQSLSTNIIEGQAYDGRTTGGVISFNPHDVIHNSQLIKFVNSDDGGAAAAQELVSKCDGEPSENLQGYCTTATIGRFITNSQTPKVNVISNVPYNPGKVSTMSQHQNSVQTLHHQQLSHQHDGHSAINLINNGKNVNFVNAYITKTTLPGGKVVNIPFKSNQTNQLQHQIIAAGKSTSTIVRNNQIIPKVNVQRNLQFVTRPGASVAGKTSSGNLIMSRTATGISKINQQILIQQPNYKTVTNNVIKHKTTGGLQSVKILSGHKQPGGNSLKTIIPHQKGGGATMIKSNESTGTIVSSTKYYKQFSSSTNNNNAILAPTYVSAASNQRILSTQQAGQGVQSASVTNQIVYATNSNHHGNSNQNQIIQYQKPSNINNMLIQNKIIKGGKYVVQQQSSQQQTHIMLPSATSVSGGNIVSIPGSVQHLKISQPFSNNVVGNSSTIKYVNAQGNVTQPSTKVRAILQQSSSASLMATDTSSVMSADLLSPSSASAQGINISGGQTIDEMIANRQITTDETIMSAKILQSLSQPKIVYTGQPNTVNNQRVSHKNYHQTHSKMYVSGGKNDHNLNHLTSPPIYVHRDDSRNDRSYKVNSSDLSTTSTTTFIHNIPLNLPRGDNLPQQRYEDDDELIGEEIRPEPLIPIDGLDHKMKSSVHDHTYSAKVLDQQQTVVKAVVQSLPENVIALSSANIQSAGLNYGFKPNTDDDANSAISTGSRNANNHAENDLGEETETAPEAEGEDDSVTRCICDLTHDDGYMICCDKCSAWQHVDCMGIDRQNIPEEYKCELCQPRTVDKQRARTLQLMKRKEQQSLMMFGTPQQQQLQNQTTLDPSVLSSGLGAAPIATTTNLLNKPAPGKKYKKDKILRKNELTAFAAAKREKKLAARANGKPRKEPKKISKRKAKQLAGEFVIDKSLNLRSWIENYEQAITNHYSPELRARLHAMGKQNQLTKELIPLCLKNLPNLESNCATIPHAGGKILISMMPFGPNVPIIEIRGKYMLSSQYRHQQAISPAGSVRNHQYNRKPGPFIFFYRLPNDGPEICIDTRTYGNDGRFVRRSCRPNSEVLHSLEKGTIHLYIVSLTNIANGTEITIRHEPHDMAAVARGSTVVSTSTACACGCPKDCLFSMPTPTTPTPSLQFPSSAERPLKPPKKINGSLLDENGLPIRKTKSTRGRSVSSSGDSNIGLLSPTGILQTSMLGSPVLGANLLNQVPQISVLTETNPANLPTPTIISSDYNPDLDEPRKEIPMCMRPQTLELIPSETFKPQPTPMDKIMSPPMIPMNQQPTPIPLPPPPTIVTMSAAESLLLSPKQCLPSPVITQKVATPQKHIQSLKKITPQKARAISFSEEIPPTPSPPAQVEPKIRPITPIISNNNVFSPPPPPPQTPSSNDESISSPVTIPVVVPKPQQIIPIPPASPTADAVAVTETQSPVAVVVGGQQNRPSRTEHKDKEKDNSPKLTREERKMQAIMKAFEKMEKNQERKQQQKQNNKKRRSSSPPSPKHRSGKGDDHEKSYHPRKKKRKGSKSYQNLNSQKKIRRRSRMNSGDSELMTSEESTPLLSPPLPSSHNGVLIHSSSPFLHDHKVNNDSNVSSAAGLLLALSHSHSSDDNRSSSAIVPPLVSSTCLLVEAAVAPLEQTASSSPSSNDIEMKYKGKTKKSIMNDWLNHEADIVEQKLLLEKQQQQANEKAFDNIMHEAATLCKYSSSTRFTKIQSEPENLTICTKQVEEFIHLSDSKANTPNDEEEIKWSASNSTNFSNFHNGSVSSGMPFVTPTNCTNVMSSGGSAAKKRWLRQAISEECNDDLPSPSNGFTTPLKKRRVIRECSETSAEDLSPQSSFNHSLVTEIAQIKYPGDEIKVEIKGEYEVFHNIENKEEVTPPVVITEGVGEPGIEPIEQDDEIDIVNSPPPGEKIVAEDNLVKIEPEDVEKDEKIDVEENSVNQEDNEEKKEDIFKTEEVFVEEDEIVEKKTEQVVKMDEYIVVKLEDVEDSIVPETEPRPENDEEMEVSVEEDPSEASAEIKVEESSINVEPLIESTIKEEDPIEVDPVSPIEEVEDEPVATEIVQAKNKVLELSTDTPDSNEDEIADIQKRLHSFHTENLFILKSRNKKCKPLVVKPPSPPSTPPTSSASSPEESSQATNKSKKSPVLLNFNLNVEANETVSLKLKDEKDDDESITIKEEKKDKEERHTRWDKPDDSRYSLSSSIPTTDLRSDCIYSTFPSYSTTASQPPQLPTIHIPANTPASHLQYYNAFYNKFNTATTTPSTTAEIDTTLKSKYPSLLSDYLETGKSSSFIQNYTTPGTSTLMDQPPTSYYSVGAPTSLLSNFLNKSYSTSAVPSNSSSIATDQLVSSTSVPNLLISQPPKVLTRTQSADPRLNPNLNTPEPPPAPKRKLSINEYRKRKQLSSESSCADKTSSDVKSASIASGSNSDASSLEHKDIIGVRVEEKEKDVLFSPAPTELEMQQEILSQRVKSFKSLHALTNLIQKPEELGSSLPFVSKDKETTDTTTNLSFDAISRTNRLSVGSNSSSSSSSTNISSTPTPHLDNPNHSPAQPMRSPSPPPSTSSTSSFSSSTSQPTTPLSSKR